MHQRFLIQRQADKGMTLIELLVVIVLMGVLAAIALPSYLNQAGKARGSEAKSTLGSINRSQQSYRWEKGIFASDLANLDIKVQGKFYTYTLGSSSATSSSAMANITTTGGNNLKRYSAAVAQTSSDFFGQIICESLDLISLPGVPIAPTTAAEKGTCPDNSKFIN